MNLNKKPLFYFYSLSESRADIKNINESISINTASENGLIEVVKYLYETCHADVEIKDNYYGCTPINNASNNTYREVVKYLETCHANK